MGSKHLRCLVASLAVLCLCAPPALARQQFRPRIGAAMGIEPRIGTELASGPSVPVVFHGGMVMRGVTIHTIFWAPRGFRFSGSPSPGVLGYEPMIQRFFGDVAHDSGTNANEFGVLDEFGQKNGAGLYSVAYNASVDSIDDGDPYPPQSKQCPSPAGVATCVTDLQVRQEVDRVISAHDPHGRGLHDIWFVLLPPNVDECITVGSCGTTAFAGYHSLSDLHGLTIYAAIPDPLIEFAPPPGQDPQSNPEAESTIDTVAHETVEAITNPIGSGWMDPNGFEVADKCENPEIGTPLGFAGNGSPYNQLINGRQYLLQAMWSNVTRGCVQTGQGPGSALPMQTVDLNQFSSSVSGATGLRRGGISVLVGLLRTGNLVAVGTGRTRSNGTWGPVTLRSPTGAVHGLGDDRDAVAVEFRSSELKPDLIATANGGDPFSESGWTGWFVLDHGYAVGSNSIQLAPCGQTGVLSLRVQGVSSSDAANTCDTESDVAVVPTRALRVGTRLSMSSEDNRAVAPDNRPGALVKMTIPLGEPRSVSSIGNPQILFNPTGFPTCSANLQSQVVRCSGLVRRARYSLIRRRRRAALRAVAAETGTATFKGFAGGPGITGGDVLTLENRPGRILTVLHVAHLRVDIRGQQTLIASGSCQPDDYFGPPATTIPTSAQLGAGPAGDGTTCPLKGSAAGLSAAHIAQTDDLSGGQTVTQIPNIVRTTPLNGETLYGSFIALAQTGAHGSVGFTNSPVSLTITTSGRKVFQSANVHTSRGVVVGALNPGSYVATWVLKDVNGDTRTISTGFVEAP